MPRLGKNLLWCTALFVGVAVTPLALRASSVNIFNTFGSGYSRSCCAAVEVGTPNGQTVFTEAMAFTPNMTSPLFAIDVAVVTYSEPGSPFTLALMTNNGGEPGSIIESWSLTATFFTFSCDHCVETALSSRDPVLQAGTTYWLVASPGPGNPPPGTDFIDNGWMLNNVGALGTSASSINGGTTWTVTNGNFAAFDVKGITAVPEPSTLVMLGTGLLSITAAVRRRFIKN
jgi:hypothetical protein